MEKIMLPLLMLLSHSAFAQLNVDILEPKALQALDQPGLFSIGTILGSPEAKSLAELTQSGNPKYAALNEIIKQDVQDILKISGEKMAFSSEQAEKLAPAGNVARHFDPHWLTSKDADFSLIAVVNRIDKRDFYADTCGEVRFIYRLGYRRGVSKSTLPMFLNVVYDYKRDNSGNCAGLAQSWQNPAADMALNKANISLKQIELNMQIVRFPSGQKIDFGGQAIYMFRIFRESADGLVSIPLENTPDVAAVSKSKSLREALTKQISENLQKIDNGVYVLENSEGKLLATRALSFSTNGRARLANKAFTAIYGADAADLANLNLAPLKYVKSAQGLIERLNNNTCTGCHQTGGTAGFHMLGYDGGLNSPFNRVILPFSPHYASERLRRSKYLHELTGGKEASTFRPLSIHPAGTSAQDRELCLMDNKDINAGFTCESESECKLTVENKSIGLAIGECVLKQNTVAGHICRKGVIATNKLEMANDIYNLFAFRDKIDINKVTTSSSLACGNPKGGVPLGRISKICDSNSSDGKLEFVEKLDDGGHVPKEICAMRGGPQFDECAKTSNPPECLAKAKIVRALLDSCYPGHSCREDYICQQLPAEVSRLYSGSDKIMMEKRIAKMSSKGIGFCVPNYFVFNMRLDGHIIPEGRSR